MSSSFCKTKDQDLITVSQDSQSCLNKCNSIYCKIHSSFRLTLIHQKMEITHKNVKKRFWFYIVGLQRFYNLKSIISSFETKHASELDSRHARFYLIKLSARFPCVYNVLWLISIYLQILKVHMRTLLTVFHNSSWKNISMKSL